MFATFMCFKSLLWILSLVLVLVGMLSGSRVLFFNVHSCSTRPVAYNFIIFNESVDKLISKC